jgi:hypothetical protein
MVLAEPERSGLAYCYRGHATLRDVKSSAIMKRPGAGFSPGRVGEQLDDL